MSGATVWTFDQNGELRAECAVIAGDNINGVQMDEDGMLYFTNSRPRSVKPDGDWFWAAKTGRFSDPNDKSPGRVFTGTLIKSRGENVRVLLARSPVRLDPLPNRPPDLIATDWPNAPWSKDNWAWVEGAEWLYAGASPIISTGCRCPQLRIHTDWYKRTFTPEAYRHSVGVLDAGGNLIMHLGRYGNFDSGNGPKSNMPVDGGISFCGLRFIAGTDNYLVFEDYAERFAVLKINYHAEESAPIKMK